jgi:hypothetical protein
MEASIATVAAAALKHHQAGRRQGDIHDAMSGNPINDLPTVGIDSE